MDLALIKKHIDMFKKFFGNQLPNNLEVTN